MLEKNHSFTSRLSSLIVYLPAVSLALLVIVFENSDNYQVYGHLLIGGSFLGGVVFVLLSLSLYVFGETSEWPSTLLLLGGSLIAGGTILYLIFGCVFGCPS